MDEFALIDRYFRRAGGSGVALGVGDDGAVLEPPAGRNLVAVVDTLVAGVHYPDDLPAADVGFRAVAVNLSDLAAMGAEPAWMTLALTLPAADADWLDAFAAGLFAAADEHGVALVGGDTTRGPATVVSVQLLGHTEPGRELRRAGARPGDLMYLSGHPGDAAAGLAAWQSGQRDGPLVGKFRRPAARVALGQAAAGLASAAIDVSDGLAADLGHVLAASGCAAVIDVEDLPLSDALLAAVGAERALDLALGGGDDYELCIAVPAGAEAAFREAAAATATPVTAIGRFREGAGLQFKRGGRRFEPGVRGYRHFAAPGEPT